MCIKFKERLRTFATFIIRHDISDATLDSIIQFIKFGIVGISNTVIGYLIYLASLYILRRFQLWSTIDIFIAQFIMFVLSVAWSFYWNNNMVFQANEGASRNVWAALMKTYVSYAFTSLFLAEVLLLLWVNICGISEFIAPLITLVITIPINFLLQKFWAFGKGV